jgi:hypothetical protein
VVAKAGAKELTIASLHTSPIGFLAVAPQLTGRVGQSVVKIKPGSN